jgi:hypothetical protein
MFSARVTRIRSRAGSYRTLVFAALAVMLVAASFVALPRERDALAASPATVKLGYFYIPPADGTSPSTLASNAGFITLTQGHEAYRDSVRASGYTGDILQYIVAAEVEGPGPYANASASCDTGFDPLNNQVTDQIGDFCKYVHPNESWFLHNGAGKRLYSDAGKGVHYRMNPAASGWQKFALGRMKADLASLGYNGIFLDNVELSWVKSAQQLDNSDGIIREFSSDSAFRNAWLGYLSQLSATLRPTGKLWANMVNDPNDGSNWNAYLQYLDGGMFESFAVGYHGLSPQKWDNNLRQAEAALNAGKGVLAVSAGPKTDAAKQTFALSSYLLITDGADAYFRYVSDTNAHEYTSFWLYPNYNVELGNPVGPRYLSGSVWRRDFDCGYVTVDPAAKTGKITTTTCAKRDDQVTPSPTNTPVPTNTPAPTNTPVPTNTPAPTQTPTQTPSSTLNVVISGVTLNEPVSGTISVRAGVRAPRDDRKVRFYLDGGWVWTEGLAPYYLGGDTKGVPAGFDTHVWKNGNHTLSVVVTNPDGSEVTKSVPIIVQN